MGTSRPARRTSRRPLRFLGVVLSAVIVLPLAAPAAIAATEPVTTTRVVVRFAPQIGVSEQDRIMSRHGADVVQRIGELDMVIADVSSTDPSSAILALFGEPGVVSADLDRTRTATGSSGLRADDTGWALRRVGSGLVDPQGSSTLAILDTGLDIYDANLTGQVIQGWSAFGGDELSDPNGHGTAMAEIAVSSPSGKGSVPGVAPSGVLVMPLQVLDAHGVGRDSDIIRGIVEAVSRQADVILMSFAATGYSTALQSAIDYAWASGAVLVAPVGDGASTAPMFPAAGAKVMGVAATTSIDSRWDGSNVGASAFIAAPGDEVPTASGTFTGTAAAAAMVAGGAGLLAAADRTASNSTIIGRLARGADPVGPRPEVGNGRLDMAASLADRSVSGLVPSGALNGAGGPFVTDYSDGALPLAGWGDETAAFSDGPVLPVSREMVTASAPILVLITAIAMFLTWRRPSSLTAEIDGAVLQQHSFFLSTAREDASASDHGVFTYGSVSPPALCLGANF